MKIAKVFLIVLLFILVHSNVHSQWVTIRSVPGEELYCIDFINTVTGYAAGSIPPCCSIVLKTTNEGVSWDYALHVADGDRIECIDFINDQTGFAGTYNGKIFKTTNGGTNWSTTQIITGKDSRILKMEFINAQTGWVGTERGYFKTINSGISWNIIGLNYPPFFGHDMYFFNNSLTGFVCSSQNIYRTTDGGNTYSNVFNHNTGQAITSINFINDNTGWACGSHRLIIKTTNSGINWNLLSMDSIQNECHDLIYNAGFANSNVGYIVGQRFCGGIWGTSFEQLFRKTTDGGHSWNYVLFYSGLNAIQDFQFTDSLNAFAVGYYGRIFKNSRAGLTDIVNTLTEIPSGYFLNQNYPNPFNPSTNLEFGISNPGFVSLKVYNSLGIEVAVLVNETKPAGLFTAVFDGSNLSSGIYFYKLEAGDFTETKRMVLLK